MDEDRRKACETTKIGRVVWGLWFRYALHNGELQVRLPFGSPPRAKAALRMLNIQNGRAGRIERGTLIYGGKDAWALLWISGAPEDVCESARRLIQAPPSARNALWPSFCATVNYYWR